MGVRATEKVDEMGDPSREVANMRRSLSPSPRHACSPNSEGKLMSVGAADDAWTTASQVCILTIRPTALSTKKQVSRTRQIISLPSRQSHDPRFLSTAGRLDPSLHAKGYNFLPELLATEMAQLRQSLAAAVKLEKSCPLREKPQRTAEREAIERDVARLRTKLDRQKIAQREREALAGVKKEEREKRKEGKGAWYMKKGASRFLYFFFCVSGHMALEWWKGGAVESCSGPGLGTVISIAVL